MYKIMALDDDKFILAALQRSLRKKKNWQVETFSDVNDALENARRQRYDLFLSDYQMPGTDGIEFLTIIKALQPTSIRIMLSAQDSMELVQQEIKEADIYTFVNKPVQPLELINVISKALQHYEEK